MIRCLLKTWRLTLAVFIAVSLSGCVSPSQKLENSIDWANAVKADLQATPVCCDNWADIPVLPLQPAERLTVNFPNENGDARHFASGISYFQGLDLSGFEGIQILMIKSEIIMDSAVSGLGRVFVPSIQFLDSSFRRSSGAFEPKTCFATFWSERGYFSAISFDSNSSPNAVVYSNFEKLDKLHPYWSSGTVGGPGLTVISVTASHDIPRSADAKLEIWIAEEDDNVLSAIGSECLTSSGEL